MPSFTFDRLETNTCLKYVHVLSSNLQYPLQRLQALSKLLWNNRTIEVLQWDIGIRNDFDRDEVDDFNRALSSNTTLNKLILFYKANPDKEDLLSSLVTDSRVTMHWKSTQTSSFMRKPPVFPDMNLWL